MANFDFIELPLEGLYLISPFIAEDNRGHFLKSYEKDIFKMNGIDTDVFETFESLSKYGVIRGLHFQTDCPQTKIVRCVAGEVYDVAVDLRRDSRTFGEWHGEYLNYKNRFAMLIPAGFAHGFVSLTENSIVQYTCCGKYSKGTDTGIKWDDKEIGIKWPLDGISNLIISERDKKLMSFEEYTNMMRG